MPEEGRKPRTVLPSGIPKEWRDFVRCRRDSLDIKPGELDWLPNFPSLELKLEEGAKGSVVLRLTGLGGAINIGISISVQDGRLVADTSDIPIPGDSAGKWINNFNADLKANGMQLSDASVRDGKLHLEKKKIAPTSDTATSVATVDPPPLRPPPPPAHITDPIPEPVPHQSEATPPPAPPPAHVTDPIPDPIVIDEPQSTDGDQVSDESIPHGEQAALQTSFSDGANVGVARRWAKWSRVGAATAGAFVLSVAAFFIFVEDQEESPSTTLRAAQSAGDASQETAETTNSSEVAAPTTSSEPPVEDEPLSIGMDDIGDQEDGNTSQPIEPGQEIPGGDIKEVSHLLEEDGTHTITFYLAGNGEQFTGPGNAWYDVIVAATDSSGGQWRANGAWFSGQYTDRGIRVGPPEPGQQALPDGLVAITFLGPDSFEMNVDGGGEPLDLSTFTASIGVSADGETLWDSAVGEAGSS
jgi:hypothetical protein